MAKKEQKSSKSDKAKNGKSKSSDKAKGGEELTPLEKARLARAAGKGGKTKAKAGAKKKNALPLFRAPEDFKPHFMTVMMKVEKDGLLSSSAKMTRYQGRYDPNADDKKKCDVASYDQKTVQGVLSRFAMVTYVTNVAKRLPAGAVYQVLLRVNRKAADGSISVLFKGMEQAEKSKKTGRVKMAALEKTDPVYRRFRKAGRLLPPAFKEVLMPPKRVRGAKKEEDDE